MTLRNIDPGRDHVLHPAVVPKQYGIGERNLTALARFVDPFIFKDERRLSCDQSFKTLARSGFVLPSAEDVPEDLALEFSLAISGHLLASSIAANNPPFRVHYDY